MSTKAQALLHDALERGISLGELLAAMPSDVLLAAAQARRAEPTEQEPQSPLATTLGFLGAWETPEPLRVILSGDPTCTEDLPLVEGLSRYVDLGPLGEGGMGEVRRVRDRRLGRVLALKTIHTPALGRPERVARFLEEAQATAQLQHPGIIPIHDLGEFPDGRLWFTMKEVSGMTFGAVISEVHAVSKRRWREAQTGWNLRRLVDALRQVCGAVGYAHTRGVVHRDLKPSNVMVGVHGEVMVLDWGLAKILGRPGATSAVDPVETDRSSASAHQTMEGQVAGTPAYMPPEQALGQMSQVDARSDVYSLGAILYELLAGRPPYTGNSALDLLVQVRSGPPASLGAVDAHSETLTIGLTGWPNAKPSFSGPPLPPALVAICEKAMAREPGARFPTAVALASELQAWLDGAKRRKDALALVEMTAAKVSEAEALRSRASVLRAEAAALLDDIEDWRPEEDKWPGWKKEDEAAGLLKQADLTELEVEILLRGSLTHAPDLIEAHAALTARYRDEHAAIETAREDTARSEALFRQHLAALPDDHADRSAHVRYLEGDGALSLVTDPPGAEVLLHRYVVQNRRLVLRFERSLGTSPLDEVTLPMGSYLCILEHPECHDVRYPVFVGRSEHWHGVRPGGCDPDPILLPRRGELGPEDCYVPAGWFQSGRSEGDGGASLSPRRLWVGGHVFRRFSTTNRQYLNFLDALVAEGRTGEALRYAPRQQGGTAGEEGALIYGFDGTRFSLRADAEGDVWKPEWPVIFVEWFGANAFAAWESRRTGRPWQLPGELAWEKAARGVDGRSYPWGDAFDPSWACMDRSHRDRLLPADVGTFPVDESPYGVQDMAGNMQDWCMDVFDENGPPDPSVHRHADEKENSLRVFRGGSWLFPASLLRASVRGRLEPNYRGTQLGFRLARSYPSPSVP